MTAEIIDGKLVAQEIRQELKAKVEELAKSGIVPGLGVILVGEDPASQSYVKAKDKACKEIGIFSDQRHLPATTTQEELLAIIDEMNNDPKINGILVQLPLPKGLDESSVIMAINPEKDVDGFHPVSVGRMVIGEKAFLPCTPHGVLQLLKHKGIETSGAEVVIVGRSNIVGKPLANLMARKWEFGNATVTICHTRTRNMAEHVKRADIVIAAAGCPNAVTADMVRDGAVVIDVGVNRVDAPERKRGYKLVGDVDFEAVKEKASYITPVPGGVGPMTITMLMFNTVESAEIANNLI